MIVCKNCKHQEPAGAIFCSECGMQLIQLDVQKTQNIGPDTGEIKTTPTSGNVNQSTWISLHLLDNGQILPIGDRTEFTLGRISDKQPIMPDIDLTPHQAFEHGVSRLHAVIRLHEGQVSVMDLGSANGTYVNGVRLFANTDSPLRNNDILALGKLKIQIMLNI